MTKIADAKILIISADGFEQSELEVPRDRLREAGATVTVATPDGKNVKGWKDKNWGPEAEADAAIGAVSTNDFDALVIPGGQINPDILRAIPEAVLLVKDFAEAGKPIAAICHGPWLLVQADILKGRKATSYVVSFWSVLCSSLSVCPSTVAASFIPKSLAQETSVP